MTKARASLGPVLTAAAKMRMAAQRLRAAEAEVFALQNASRKAEEELEGAQWAYRAAQRELTVCASGSD